MPKLIVDYVPEGAVPSTPAAGIQYRINMILSAIRYHEEGDDTDPACCTGDDPCAIRVDLVRQQRDLAGKALDERAIQTRKESTRTPGTGSSRTVSNPATPPQLGYIDRLIKEHDTRKLSTYPARTLSEIRKGATVSSPRASSLIEALLKAPRISGSTSRPTDPQMSLIQTMCTEQGREIPTDLTFETAKALISELIGRREAQIRAAKIQTPKVTEDGMYRTPDGTVYKVQIAKQGSGHLYAKKLTQHEDESWSFDFAKGAIHRLTADMKMTLDQAKEFGQLYGVCCKCGADLTDERSIERGIGPVCEGKWR